MNDLPIIGKSNSRDPLDDYRVKVTKKDCALGFHGAWEVETDTDYVLHEVCIVCNKKMSYDKEGGKMNEKLYFKMHKIDFLQPYSSGGEPNPDFFKYYGDPSEQDAIIT